MPPPAAVAPSVGATHVTNILKNYSNEQVVYALMTQLREREAQLTSLSEERRTDLRRREAAEDGARKLRDRVASCNRSLAEKDTRIAQLERRLADDRGNDDAGGSAAAQAAAVAATAAAEAEIQARDEELSRLRPMLEVLRGEIDAHEREGKADAEAVARVEEELDSVRGEIAAADHQKRALGNAIEELEKKLKGKEWVVKSLRDESGDQRGRENHLRAHIEKLNQKIETYETRFEGKGEDVPMLIAKLKDYEARVKDLQRQVRRLTNRKLNELVLRSTPLPKQPPADAAEGPTAAAAPSDPRGEPSRDEEDDVSRASEAYSSLADSEMYEEEEGEDCTFASTIVSNGSDDEMEQFYAKSVQDEDVLGDFLSEVRAGVESLQGEGLCCAQQEDGVFPPASDKRGRRAAGGRRVPSRI